jgi:glycosyltransferase involved in cell wall biosynthesis
MKVLLSALACEPDRGSEPEVGFRAMLAAASLHDVWVLTLPESVAAIERALDGDPRAGRIHLEGIPFRSKQRVLRNLTSWEFHLEYDRWQRRAAQMARDLDRSVDFDVVHHVTLASYWTRAGVAELGKPMVWGPVGGGVDPPIGLFPDLGRRGVMEAVARIVGRPLVALLPPARNVREAADVVLVQNPDTGRRLRRARSMRLLSNAFAVAPDPIPNVGPRTSDVVVVGRLVAWKAPILALHAMRFVRHPAATLRFFGDGPDQSRLETKAEEWGLSERIRFEGWVPRPTLLPEVARAGVLVHPAVHEEAGLCIAEALALGTPVVALDHGGPAQIVGQWRGTLSALVAPSAPDVTARRIAAAIDRFLMDPPIVPEQPRLPNTSFQDEVLSSYEMAVGSGMRRRAQRVG